MNSDISRIYRIGALLMALTAAIILLAGFQYMAVRASSTIQAAQVPAGVTPLLADKVIVVNMTGTINIIDTATDIVYGPYLTGSLGTSIGQVLDVAVTPNGNKALISNFLDRTIFFVDVSNPYSPSVIITATVPMFAEDIAISPDGKFALVTDGAFNPNIATIDLISNTFIFTTSLNLKSANAVAIAPNGTVVLADYFNGELHSMLLGETGVLTYTGSYSYTIGPDGSVSENLLSSALANEKPMELDNNSIESPVGPLWAPPVDKPMPVNVAIAPDGQTVLMCNASPYTSTTTTASFDVGVYQITAPGVLSFCGAIIGLSRATQSIAFSPAGDKAYLSGNGGTAGNLEYDQLAVLDITGPGIVKLEQTNKTDFARVTGSQLFGVDTIAVANGKAYLGFPTAGGATKELRIVNLSDYSVKKLTMSGIPMGIGVIPLDKLYLPNILKAAP